MKKHIIYGVLIVLTCYAGHSQGKSGSVVVSASYPIPVGNNFVANPPSDFNKYIGIYGLGLGYHHGVNENLSLCFDLRYSYNYRQESIYRNIISASVVELIKMPSMNLDNWNPSLGVKYNFQMGAVALVPQVNFGYALIRFYRNQDPESIFYYQSHHALTFSSRLKVDYRLSPKRSLGVFLTWDNYIMNKHKTSAETSFNKRNQWSQFLFPGIEFRHKI